MNSSAALLWAETVLVATRATISGAKRRNAENVLVLRRNRDLAQAYEANWRRQQALASPYAAPRR